MKRTATFFSATPGRLKMRDRMPENRNENPEVSPSEFIIRNLLNYSKALTVLKTNDAGTIHMVMN